MEVHEANHDMKLVFDLYACAEYVSDYLTKAEGGMSKILHEINEEGKDLSQMELLNKLSSTLDKHRSNLQITWFVNDKIFSQSKICKYMPP